jgi:hypothetical protein
VKAKPNTDQFKQKKDPSAFLEGASADQIEKTQQSAMESQVKSAQPTADGRVNRHQKVFRLSLDLIQALKRESYERSVEKGSRVTETDLVEQALRVYLKI